MTFDEGNRGLHWATSFIIPLENKGEGYDVQHLMLKRRNPQFELWGIHHVVPLANLASLSFQGKLKTYEGIGSLPSGVVKAPQKGATASARISCANTVPPTPRLGFHIAIALILQSCN